MSWSIPSGFGPTIKAFLLGAGDPVLWQSQDDGVAAVPLVGSVQRPGTTTLTGDVIQEGFVVYLPGDSFGALVPAKFDRLTINGQVRTIEEAVPLEAGGQVLAWQLRVLG